MNNYKTLNVILDGRRVGTLATASDYRVAFEYDTAWLAEGFSISPLSLPLEKGVFVPKNYETFEGLFGVFSDSLPGGWLIRGSKAKSVLSDGWKRMDREVSVFF